MAAINGFFISTKVYAGEGQLKVINEWLSGIGAKSVMLVYDRGIKEAGLVETIRTYIDETRYRVVTFDGIHPEPSVDLVEAAVKVAKEACVDAAIAIGGGSAMDTTSAMVSCLAYPERSFEDLVTSYERGLTYDERPTIPRMNIPTTAGTGAEVGDGCVISNKEGIKCTVLVRRPDVAVIDPVMTIGLPLPITAATGMDALSHCIGGYTTNLENVIGDAFAEKGIRLILKNLPLLFEDSKNMRAREEMSIAATLGGYVIASSILHIEHSYAHILGAMYHVPHGIGCAIALPYAVEFVADAKPEKVSNLCEIFGLDTTSLSDREKGTAAKEFLLGLNRKFHIPKLKEIPGLVESDLPAIAEKVVHETYAEYCPRKLTFESAVDILKSMYAE